MKLLHSTGTRNIIAFLLLFIAMATQAQKPVKVFVMQWHDEINPQSERYVELALKEAVEQKSDLIIFDMDTYGGALHNADHIRTQLLDCKIPVIIWINKNAASAGALIAIACDSIYMEDGANIGAATVVGSDGEPLADKYQAYMRSIMRSTAQANHRDPLLAAGMVGTPVGVDSLTVGNVISFTTEEAITKGYCDGKAHSIDDILKLQHLTNVKIEHFELSTTDTIIDFFLQPWLRGLLILLIFGGFIMEMKSPGLGLPIIVAMVSIVLFFIPSYMNGLAQNWEILIFFLGVILLLLEIFVIPGFGVTGIAGITLVFAGLILVMLNNDVFDFSFVSKDEIYQSSFIVLLSIAMSIVFLLVASRYIIRSKFFKRVSLQTTMESSAGFTTNVNTPSLVGLQGEAYTVLRPSGKINVDGKIYDAYTGGEYIEKGEKIEVTGENINNLKVKKI
jgi:membrane-bound serine protease (ClpP class)